MKVVDSPPGMTNPSRPSSCSGLRISTASAPRPRSMRACSRKFPCSASTPILSGFMCRIVSANPRRDQAADETSSSLSRDVAARRALGAPVADEPLQVSERLRRREAAKGRRELPLEQGERHLVGRERPPIERRRRAVEALAVVLDDLPGTTGGILDRVLVPCIGNARVELDDPPKRLEVVAERVGPRVRVEPDR